jgi:hypothetical protein
LRKFITIALTLLLVLSFAAIAFAIHVPDVPSEEQTVTAAGAKITLGGRILVRGWYFNNVLVGDILTDDGTVVKVNLPSDTNDKAEYTTNAYLVVNAKLSDNLQAYMELETAGSGNNNSGLFHWGSLDTKPDADLRFRELWIQYTGSGLLGVPAGIKVGHMPLTLGEKQFLNHERFGDDAIVLFVYPVKELELDVITVKLVEGAGSISGANSRDLDYYGIVGMYKLDKDNTIGLNYSYINWPAIDLKFQNLGLHANGLLMGALTYGAEFDWQFGSVFADIDKQNFKGWGILAKVGYKIDPVNLRASFAMGSGSDENDNDIKEFQTTVANPNEGPQARFVHYTQIYERTITTAAQRQVFSTTNSGEVNTISTGIANTTYFNLGLDFMPMKALNLSLDGFYLQATETPDNVSDKLGWEVDFKGSYKITKNLTYFVEAGWFDAGNFYGDQMSELGLEKKSVTQIVHGLNLTF